MEFLRKTSGYVVTTLWSAINSDPTIVKQTTQHLFIYITTNIKDFYQSVNSLDCEICNPARQRLKNEAESCWYSQTLNTYQPTRPWSVFLVTLWISGRTGIQSTIPARHVLVEGYAQQFQKLTQELSHPMKYLLEEQSLITSWQFKKVKKGNISR